MHPFVIKDTIGIILSFLSKKDRYSLLSSNENIKNLFSKIEFYELVGWQVLADEDHEEGLEYFKRTKALQNHDILNYYYHSNQPQKLTRYDFKKWFNMQESLFSDYSEVGSYERIKFQHEYLNSFDFDINNINSLKYALENNIDDITNLIGEELSELNNIECLRFILNNFSINNLLLNSVSIMNCKDLEFFHFLEIIFKPNNFKETLRNPNFGQIMLLDSENEELVNYAINTRFLLVTRMLFLAPYLINL